VRVYDVAGDEPVELGSVTAPDTRGIRWDGQARGELLLVDGRVVALGHSEDSLATTVTTIDLADPGSPTVVDTTEVQGTVSAARLHGSVVRLMVGTGLPELDFVDPDGDLTVSEATRAN